MNFNKPLKTAQESPTPQYQSNIAPHFSGKDLPPNAIIVSNSNGNEFTFRKANEHGILFSVSLGGPEGLNEAARKKIVENGLENERFFFQMGHNNEFIEATQRLVG